MIPIRQCAFLLQSSKQQTTEFCDLERFFGATVLRWDSEWSPLLPITS